ncbi:MOSC domain-containing protein [Deinococcus cavernae]|uniref:MOSC domain-containing protein n=1 Tax=Deinococcus cavernae TaxID=2320857 RepID=A0A418V9B3_9DEIO|nr:MOSC N-terminal beta barrel domain-containing protein [Deinococcus cavernae]RJF72669.1 MOSC domain-containing protein [Deinococcus cavernae]
MPEPVGHVTELFRYPIKSVGGEHLTQTNVTERGLTGDRFWAVEDENGKFGSGKSTRRFRQMNGLLNFRAFSRGETPVLVRPDGTELDAISDEAATILSEHTGKTISVTPERGISHFDEGAIHFITTSALSLLRDKHGSDVDVRRFRPNIVLDTGTQPRHLEADWLGQRLSIGASLVLEVAYLMPRCVMVNMAQHDLGEDNHVLKTISKINPEVCFGAFARVIRTGQIRLGDTAQLI